MDKKFDLDKLHFLKLIFKNMKVSIPSLRAVGCAHNIKVFIFPSDTIFHVVNFCEINFQLNKMLFLS